MFWVISIIFTKKKHSRADPLSVHLWFFCGAIVLKVEFGEWETSFVLPLTAPQMGQFRVEIWIHGLQISSAGAAKASLPVKCLERTACSE